ncbi:MAG: hypothetical protein HRU28_00450 [Rhizobiales bacterium]|nr:hypothetical protein [Hyphomicrobiales bacterium]
MASGSNYILHVKTTIDQNLQADARKAIQDSLTNEGKKYKVDQASLVSMEHDGAVLALIGGEDYGQSQFNRATSSARQPGSSFKPLVYMAALNHGFTPDSTVYDTKVQIKKWAPKNYNRRYIGRTTLNNALVKSINTIPIKLAQEIGYKNVIATAKSLGIDARLVANASLPLGTASISVLDLTGAYATIANGGTLAQPYGITEIRNGSGDLIYKRNRDEYAALVVANPGKVSQLNYMLGNVVEYGTGRRAQLPFTKAFGKTGTTQSYRDAWFMGFTKHLVTGVWFGNDNYSPTNRLTGGRLPASTFKNFMTAAYVSKFNLNLANNTHQGKANIASASKSTYAQNLAHKQANKRTIKKISRNLNIIKISSYSKKSFKNKRSKSVVTFNGKSLSEKSKTKASKKKRKITKKTRRLVKTKKTAKKIYKAKSNSKRKQRKNAAFIDANGNIVILNN